MRMALIIDGTSGIGLALCNKLVERDYSKVLPVGLIRDGASFSDSEKIEFKSINLLNNGLESIAVLNDEIDTLIITHRSGRVVPFEGRLEIAKNINFVGEAHKSFMKIAVHGKISFDKFFGGL